MVFNIYGHGGHLGHVTWIIYIHIGSHFLLMLHIKFGFDWPSGFREKIFEKCVWTTDRPRSRDDLDLNHIPSSKPLVVCIYHFSGLRLQ